jgi:hypothetical protein
MSGFWLPKRRLKGSRQGGRRQCAGKLRPVHPVLEPQASDAPICAESRRTAQLAGHSPTKRNAGGRRGQLAGGVMARSCSMISRSPGSSTCSERSESIMYTAIRPPKRLPVSRRILVLKM